MAKQDKKPQDETPSPEDDLATSMLLKEADEALRQEKMEALWKEWGSTLIGVALMIIFGTMLGVGWQNWRHSVYQKQTSELVAVQGLGSDTSNTNITDDALTGQYAGLSSLLDAGTVAVIGNDENAMKRIYNKMSDAVGADMPSPYNYMAAWGVLRTRGTIEKEQSVQLGVADEMIALADHDDNPYQILILIEAAALYGENGNPNRAIQVLERAKAQNPSDADVLNIIQQLTRLYKTNIALAQEKDQS
jgi:hypothetical protein